jgi:hypothetical protein
MAQEVAEALDLELPGRAGQLRPGAAKLGQGRVEDRGPGQRAQGRLAQALALERLAAAE